MVDPIAPSISRAALWSLPAAICMLRDERFLLTSTSPRRAAALALLLGERRIRSNSLLPWRSGWRLLLLTDHEDRNIYRAFAHEFG